MALLRALLLSVLGAGALAAQTPPASFQSGPLTFQYWPQSERLVRALAAGVSEVPFPGIADTLVRTASATVQVAPDETRFRALTGNAAPEWGAGVAMPQSGIIVLPGYGSDRGAVTNLRSVLRHELAHVLLQRRLGDARVPRWFTEGYAVWSAGQLDTEAAWMLRMAFVFDRAPALDSLELGWPAGETSARIAYLLSATAVHYLHTLGTEETFTRFLDTWLEEGSMEPALRAVYRLSGPQFERLWRKDVRQRYGWLVLVTHGTVVALLLSVIATALFLVRRRRDRRKLAALRDAELPDDPAFWLEELGNTPGEEEPGRSPRQEEPGNTPRPEEPGHGEPRSRDGGTSP